MATGGENLTAAAAGEQTPLRNAAEAEQGADADLAAPSGWTKKAVLQPAEQYNELGDATLCFTRGVEMFDETPIGGMSEAIKMKLLGAINATFGTHRRRPAVQVLLQSPLLGRLACRQQEQEEVDGRA